MLRAPCAAGRSPDRGPGQSGFEVSSPISSISPAPPGLAWGGVRSGPKRRLNCSGQSLVVSSPLGFLLSPPESLRGQSQDIPACWSSSNWETGKESGVAAAASQLWKGEEKVPDSQWITRVLLGSVSCSKWKKLPPFPPPLFPTRRKSRLPLSAAGPGSGEWARRQRGPLDFLGMGLLTACRRKKG